MKIAIISIVFPYPIDSGGSAFTFNLIDYLRKLHEITFICPNVADHKKQALQKLWPNVKILTTSAHKPDSFFLTVYKQALSLKQRVLRNGPGYFYPRTHLAINDLARCHYPDFLEQIQNELKEGDYDLVQVEFIDFAALIHLLPKTLPKIFVHHEIRYKRLEMEYQTLKHKTLRDLWHIKATKDLEISLLNQYDKVLTVSKQDTQYLIEAGVRKELLHTSPSPISFKQHDLNTPFKFKNKLVFLGPEAHYPNLDAVNWFLEESWPKISKANPQVKFQIISKWSEEFKKIHVDKPNIEFLGFVEDLSQAFDGAIMIVPLRIVSGMRMKILEGISWRVPIVSTTDGAEGLPMVDGENCMIADTPEEFIKKVNQLIETPQIADEMVERSQDLTLKEYTFDNCGRIRNEIYQSFKVVNA